MIQALLEAIAADFIRRINEGDEILVVGEEKTGYFMQIPL